MINGLPGSGKSFLVNEINKEGSEYAYKYFAVDLDDFVMLKNNKVKTDLGKLFAFIDEFPDNNRALLMFGISDNMKQVNTILFDKIDKLFWLDTPHKLINQRLQARVNDVNSGWWYAMFPDKESQPDWVNEHLLDKLSLQDEFEYSKFTTLSSLMSMTGAKFKR